MVRDSTAYLLATLAVLVGLVVVVFAEVAGTLELVVVGGAVTLAGVALLTNTVARIEPS